MKTRSTFAALVAAATLALVSTSANVALAQDKMGSGGKMMDKKTGTAMKGGKMSGGKMAMGRMVYACKGCKMYYSAADAKKMGMKDAMGHKLMAMRMTSAKKMGMKMARMGKMSGDKMGAGKMSGNKMSGKMSGGKMGGG